MGSRVFTNVVRHYYFDLDFHGHKFWNVNMAKMVRASEKCFSVTFIEINICHRMEPLRILYSMTLTFIFKVKHFLSCIGYKKWAGSGCPRQICLDWHCPSCLSICQSRLSIYYSQQWYSYCYGTTCWNISALILSRESTLQSMLIQLSAYFSYRVTIVYLLKLRESFYIRNRSITRGVLHQK